MSEQVAQNAASNQPTWPPDYSTYSYSELDNVLEALRREAGSRRAPDSYRKFLSKVIEHMDCLYNETTTCNERMRKLESEQKVYAEYLSTTSTNYDDLMELFKKERKERLKMEEKVIEMYTQLLEQGASDPTTVDLLEARVTAAEKAREEAELKLAKISEEKAESQRQLIRVAVGRQNMERDLVNQFAEIDTTRKKVTELELELQRAKAKAYQWEKVIQKKDAQINKQTMENTQLKLLCQQWGMTASTIGRQAAMPYIAQQLPQQQSPPSPQQLRILQQ
ncbi:hypothetical protein DFQ28_002279, partial [Apophysomyces sp. BC1034]